jgi:GT2 family glycosyltransferase
MIDIAMLSCNKARLTRTSIEEIARRTQTPYRLLVLDNGSVDGSREMLLGAQLLRAMPNGKGWQDKAILALENKGVHWGHNRLLDKVESGPFYVCTDSDIVPQLSDPDWLAQLIDLADRHPEYASISCRIHAFIGDSAQAMFKDAPEVVERGWMGAEGGRQP